MSQSVTTLESLLSPRAVADLLGVTVATLTNWRYAKRAPEYVRVGRRVMYTRRAIAAFIASNTQEVAS